MCTAGTSHRMHVQEELVSGLQAAGAPHARAWSPRRAKVRSVKANAYDSAYCSALADTWPDRKIAVEHGLVQVTSPYPICAWPRKDHAVHAAMAGFTCVSVAGSSA